MLVHQRVLRKTAQIGLECPMVRRWRERALLCWTLGSLLPLAILDGSQVLILKIQNVDDFRFLDTSIIFNPVCWCWRPRFFFQIYLFIYVFVYLFFIYFSNHLFIHLFISLCICLFVYSFIYFESSKLNSKDIISPWSCRISRTTSCRPPMLARWQRPFSVWSPRWVEAGELWMPFGQWFLWVFGGAWCRWWRFFFHFFNDIDTKWYECSSSLLDGVEKDPICLVRDFGGPL